MTIQKTESGSRLTLKLAGRLDTTTAPELEKAIEDLGDASELTLDFEDLEYLSSAGLRVLLMAHKKMKAVGGNFSLVHVNSDIRRRPGRICRGDKSRATRR